MLIWFWWIAALMSALVFKNVRYAVGQYLANRNRAVLTVYLALLFTFAYFVLHLTFRVLDFAQNAREPDLVQPTPYVLRRLREDRFSLSGGLQNSFDPNEKKP